MSMESFESEALILAGTPIVWDVLTDTGNYTVWDSGVLEVTGELHRPGRVRIRTAHRGRRSFRARIELNPRQVITWTIGLPLGLARVIRTFTLTDYTGITHLTVRDTATGPLRRLVRIGGPEASEVLTAYVEAVKFRAELLSFHLDGGVFPPPTATTDHMSNYAASGAR